MVELILALLVSTFASVGFIQLIKKGLKSKVAITILSFIITILISLIIAFIEIQLGNFSKFTNVFICVMIPALTWGSSQFFYQFIAKLLNLVIEFLKNKLNK